MDLLDVALLMSTLSTFVLTVGFVVLAWKVWRVLARLEKQPPEPPSAASDIRFGPAPPRPPNSGFGGTVNVYPGPGLSPVQVGEAVARARLQR